MRAQLSPVDDESAASREKQKLVLTLPVSMQSSSARPSTSSALYPSMPWPFPRRGSRHKADSGRPTPTARRPRSPLARCESPGFERSCRRLSGSGPRTPGRAPSGWRRPLAGRIPARGPIHRNYEPRALRGGTRPRSPMWWQAQPRPRRGLGRARVRRRRDGPAFRGPRRGSSGVSAKARAVHVRLVAERTY